MKRLLGQTLFAVGAGVVAVAFTPACAENDQSIFIRQVQAPPQNRIQGKCVYQPDPTQLFISEGVMDLAITQTYVASLLVGSQLMPRAEQLNVRAEPNRAHVDGLVVRVTTPDGASIGEFTSVSAGFVDPGQNNAATYGLVGGTLLDAPTAQRVGATAGNPRLVIANVKAFGKTLGGVDLESGEFKFPIQVCVGCLIDFSKGDDPASERRDCDLPLGGTGAGGTAVTLPCNLGQDELTPCQTCKDYSDACKGQTP